MKGNAPNFAGLKYFAEEELDAPFQDDAISNFQDAVEFTVNTYLALVDQAGERAADLVSSLPYANEEGGYRDAYIGLAILTKARGALRTLLENDETMHTLIQGYYGTSDAEDANARREARQYDLEHNADKSGEFRSEAREYDTGKPTENDIENSAAGGNRRQLDLAVEEAQDRHPSSAEIRLYADNARRGIHEEKIVQEPLPVEEKHDSPSTSTKKVQPVPMPSSPQEIDDPAIRLFGERPSRITVQAQDYSRSTPNHAFRGSTKWMFDHLIMVASGSKRENSFPRIAPLITTDIPIEYAVSVRELTQMVADIRHHVSRLRMPNDDGFGDIIRLMDDIDPKDPGSMKDALNNAVDAMQNRLKGLGRNRPSYADSAQEDGGWREGDTEFESWKVDDDE